VTKKLADAGIDGSFGVSDSVFYCDVWRREDGNRWYINVALLFDESGRVYKARPAQAATGVMLPSEATAVGGSSAGAANIGESRYSTAASGTAGHDDLSGTLELEPAATSTFRSGRRLPFASSDDR
jgi:hypothetical protein